MTYGIALFLDVSALIVCAIALFQCRLTHSHPATLYLFFHVYTFTWRLFGLMNGAPTLFTDWGPGFAPLREDEMVRAAVLADIALAAFTIACVIVARRRAVDEVEVDATTVPILNRKIIWVVVAVAMPLGIFGQVTLSVVPETVFNPGMSGTMNVGAMRDSGYLQILPTWPGLLLLMLIYYHGFRRWLVIPMVLYLAIMAIQGYHRFRVIIPVILLVQIYLDRNKRKWPGVGGIAVLALLAMAFFPMKIAGRMIQDRAPLSEIADVSMKLITEARAGNAGDQQFLDEFACTLTLVDEKGSYFFGKPFLAAVTLPVPRAWWPEKPGLADHIIDISRPWRPMAETGMITTYIGDAYLNFGYFGVVIFAFAIGYGMSRAFGTAYLRPYSSIFRFAYLMMAANLIQVYRDGILSIVIFTAVHMMPLTITVILHKWFAEFRGRDDALTAPSAGKAPGGSG